MRISVFPQNNARCDLVREMNGKQQMTIGDVDLFVGFFISNGKIGMTFEYQSQVKVSVDFSPDLARLSGLRSDETYVTGDDVISEREPNLSSNIRSVYVYCCLLYTSPSPRDRTRSRMPSSA